MKPGVLLSALALFAFLSCTGGKEEDSTPITPETPHETPSETPPETPHETPSETPPETPHETPSETPPETPEVEMSAELRKLRSEPLKDGKSMMFPITVNSPFSKHSTGIYPKSTVIRDYGPSSAYNGLLHIHIDSDIQKNLPNGIQEELEKQKLSKKQKTDLFFIVQSSFRNAAIIIAPSNNGTDFTRLLPHAWADPDAPNSYPGERLNKIFLFGLYEAEPSIANEVLLGTLKPFSVHTHDGRFSPRTGRININPTQSHAFYTLIIGEIYPSNEKRANITLHWVLNHKDTNTFLDLAKRQVWSDGSGKKVYKPYSYITAANGIINVPDDLDKNTTPKPDYEPVDENFGQLFDRMSQDPAFKDTDRMKKLKKLLGITR